jgi:isopentenyl-diphosphate delta-isomerase
MPRPGPTDLIDRVDDLDDPIGLVRREDVFAEHVGFRVVHVFVINSNDELLLQMVGRRRERSPLKWGSSVAGYLFAGESYAAAAGRRLRDEIGLESPLQKLGATRMQDAGATKFIELFLTTSDFARIGESDHIEALEFAPLGSIEDRLRADPTAFTETFPVVYRLFRAVVG